jgi:predicted N-acetyltransferase YhbS
MTTLLPLHSIETSRVEALLDAAFGADRFGRTAYLLRKGVALVADLSFAAVDEGKLLGTLQCWPVALAATDGQLTPLTLVGPVAVAPELQRGGIGRALMSAMLEATTTTGHDALMMIGDPEYYGRFFGFSSDATAKWELPGPFERRRLLARITRAGGVPVEGRIIPDPAFATEGLSA